MFSFLKKVLAFLCALVLFVIVVPVILIALVIGALVNLDTGKNGNFENEGVMVFDLSTNVVNEQLSEVDILKYLFTQKNTKPFFDLYSAISYAKDDDKVKAILLSGSQNMSMESMSVAQVQSIISALKDFKKSGKKVYAFLENPSTKDLLLCSVADEIFMSKDSVLDLKGLSLTSTFFGNALKKYGIGVEITKAGEHKNFGQMFISDKLDDEDKQHLQSLADNLWENILSEISLNLDVDVSVLKKVSDEIGLLSAKDVKQLNIQIKYKDELVEYFKGKYGQKDGTFKQFSVINYMPEYKTDEHIAFVYMSGDIIESSQSGYISSKTYTKLINELAKDDNVKGVLLYIDSAGGSAYASQQIKRAIDLCMKNKPVVAVYGGVSASGAYWFSAGCNKIIAEPTSITGSIGVFSLIFNVEDFAKDWGITFDGVQTSPIADIFSMTKNKSPKQLDILRKHIDVVYEDFINIVSEGREISYEQAKKLADGRVYTGTQALELKLIDAIGGIELGLNSLKDIAKLDMGVICYPKEDSFEDLLKNYTQESPFSKILNKYIKSESVYKYVDKNCIYARVPYFISIN